MGYPDQAWPGGPPIGFIMAEEAARYQRRKAFLLLLGVRSSSVILDKLPEIGARMEGVSDDIRHACIRPGEVSRSDRH